MFPGEEYILRDFCNREAGIHTMEPEEVFDIIIDFIKLQNGLGNFEDSVQEIIDEANGVDVRNN